jgi:SAM-dependent methyltransferase
VSRLGWRSYHEIRLPIAEVNRILDVSGAEVWFKWSIEARSSRGEATSAMRWIVDNMSRNAVIFETGCGCGANLIWLGQKKFSNLSGTDRSENAIAAAEALAALARLSIIFRKDDGLQPAHLVADVDCLLALNWVYYSPTFDLFQFLSQYRNALKPDGVIVMDMVDRAYDQYPRNEYLTDDWHLPPERQRPTQYKIRMSQDEVTTAARSAGFEVTTILPGTAIPPRFVTVFKRH